MRSIAVMALFAGAVVCVSPACVRAQAPVPRAGSEAPPRAGAMVLRAGDAVRAEIQDEKELSGEFVIGADGQVLLPLVGLVPVAGRSFDDVIRELRSAYAKELTNVTVRFTPLVRIAVLGEVRQPGLYLIDPTHTVSDVLARAGGLGPSANPTKVLLAHLGGQVAKLDVESGVHAIALQSGDQVRVERRSWIRENLGIFVGAAGSIAVALITGVALR